MSSRYVRSIVLSLRSILLLYLLSLAAPVANAVPDDLRVIHVPGDAPSIQAAIDMANRGDLVLVAPGVYQENPVLAKTITLASHFYTTDDPSYIDNTIIDLN